MPRSDLPQSHLIEIEYEGEKRFATYVVVKGMVTVTSDWGIDSSRLGASGAALIAGIAFRQLLDRAKARGDL